MNATRNYIKQIIAKKEAAVAELREWERQHPNFYPSERERARSEINARLMAELSEISAAAQPIVINIESKTELDGATVARKIYKYMLKEADYHGHQLITA